MKIYVIKAFSGVFQHCWEKIICSFFPARHTRNLPARKIKLVGFPASCKVSSKHAEKRQFSTSYVEMGVAKDLKSTLQWGGGGVPPYFSEFPHQAGLEMLENVINSKKNPKAVTNFPASSSEHLLFCQPARFLWGTDKARNRFVGCP